MVAMEQWEEADQAAGHAGSTADSSSGCGCSTHHYDLLVIAASTSTAVFDESACSSDNDERVTSNIEDVLVKKRAASVTSSEDEGGISTVTKDLIQRSFKDNNRRRQKLEQKRSSASDFAFDELSDILPQDEQIAESEKLNVPFVAQQSLQKDNGSTGILDDGTINSDRSHFTPISSADAAAAPTLMPANVPEEPPLLSTSTHNNTIPHPALLLGSFPSSSFDADSTINSNDRYISFYPQLSLDLPAVFNSRRSISPSGKRFANSHDSISAFSNFSHTMASVISAESDEACCRGRREWIIFVGVIVACVILFAAFVDTGGDALAAALPPSGAPSQMPSTVPTAIPTPTAPSQILSVVPTIAPSRIQLMAPTKAPTIAPSTLPPSLFPSTSEPTMDPSLQPVPAQRESQTPSVTISGATPMTVRVAIPLMRPEQQR